MYFQTEERNDKQSSKGDGVSANFSHTSNIVNTNTNTNTNTSNIKNVNTNNNLGSTSSSVKNNSELNASSNYSTSNLNKSNVITQNSQNTQIKPNTQSTQNTQNTQSTMNSTKGGNNNSGPKVNISIDTSKGDIPEVKGEVKMSIEDAKKLYETNKKYLPTKDQIIEGAKATNEVVQKSGVLENTEKKKDPLSSLFGFGAKK